MLTLANILQEILDVWMNEIEQYVYLASTAGVDTTDNIQAIPSADLPG